MTKLSVIPAVLLAALLQACALSPSDIASGLESCDKRGLIPVSIVKRDAVVSINCMPPEGYVVVEKEFSLIKLPDLPKLPTLPGS